MNLAQYDMNTHTLERLPAAPGMTPDGLREFSLYCQVSSMAEGNPLNGILVGWEDAPSDYFGIFLMGDLADQGVPKTVLDRIEQLARGQ